MTRVNNLRSHTGRPKNFFKCVVTEVVLFSIVAFKTLVILQGSVATHLRCGGVFSDVLLILTVK